MRKLDARHTLTGYGIGAGLEINGGRFTDLFRHEEVGCLDAPIMIAAGAMTKRQYFSGEDLIITSATLRE